MRASAAGPGCGGWLKPPSGTPVNGGRGASGMRYNPPSTAGLDRYAAKPRERGSGNTTLPPNPPSTAGLVRRAVNPHGMGAVRR